MLFAIIRFNKYEITYLRIAYVGEINQFFVVVLFRVTPLLAYIYTLGLVIRV